MRKLDGAQWTVLVLLLAAIGLEFVFSPYWHDFIANNALQRSGAKSKIRVTNEGFMVLAFLLFTVVLLLLLAGVQPKAGQAIAGLIFLSVFLARAQPIIYWLDETTAVLKKASGS